MEEIPYKRKTEKLLPLVANSHVEDFSFVDVRDMRNLIQEMIRNLKAFQLWLQIPVSS